jgi:hypothetical protein
LPTTTTGYYHHVGGGNLCVIPKAQLVSLDRFVYLLIGQILVIYDYA